MELRHLRSWLGFCSALTFSAALVVSCGDDSSNEARRDGAAGAGGSSSKLDASGDTGAAGSSGNKDAAADAAPDAPADVRTADAGTDSGASDSATAAGLLHLYVGCSDSTGTVQLYSLNTSTAAMSLLSSFSVGGAVSNSEFNDISERLYVSHMIGTEAKISTLARNPSTGALTLMGSPVSVPYNPPVDAGARDASTSDADAGDAGAAGDGGADAGAAPTNVGPQTLTFDRSRKFLAAPNYHSGYVYIYDMAADGTVGNLVSSHSAGSNAHHAIFTLNNKFMFVPYLASNLLETYRFDATTGALTVFGSTPLPTANSNPRHIALHPNGAWLYSINEAAGGETSAEGSIDLFRVDQSSGKVTPVQTYAVPLPTGYAGLKNGSEIEMSTAGDILYVSMRLDNKAQGSLVSYRLDAKNGSLTLVEQESSHGVTPRQFTLTADGTLLVVGNQNSNTVAVFQADPASGKMTFLSSRDVCSSPRFARTAPVK